MTDPITTPAQMREAAARLAEADAREADDIIIDAWLKDLAAAIRALPVADPLCTWPSCNHTAKGQCRTYTSGQLIAPNDASITATNIPVAERDALRAHPYLPAEEIAAIERGNRRWHGEYDTTVSVRWEPYKPDGQRQMKAKGRWQTMTYNGSGYFRWENCNRPAQVRQALKGHNQWEKPK